MSTQRTLPAYAIKNTGFQLKDLDEGNRKVSGYLSTFNVMDSDRDVIKPGAFLKSIQERGVSSESNRKIAFLWQHDTNIPIGKFTELREDTEGLRFTAHMSTSQAGEDAFRNYQEGVINEHSIGFNYIQDKIEFIEDEKTGGFWEIKELILWEGSAVTFGANPFTRVLDVAKSEGAQSAYLQLDKEMKILQKALKAGKGSDERLYNIEIQLAQLRQKQAVLFTSLTQNPLKPEPSTSKKQSEPNLKKSVIIKILEDEIQRVNSRGGSKA